MFNFFKKRTLQNFNIYAGFLHLIQGLLMLLAALSIDKVMNFRPQVLSYYLTFDIEKLALVTDPKVIGEVPFASMVAIFFFLSALFHFIVASKRWHKKYLSDLDDHMNQFRWYEYALSSSIMIVLIAVLFGIYDIGALLLIFGLNASMNLFGLLMEKMNKANKKVDWLPFIFGSVAGIIPWIVIIMYAFGNSNPAEVPWFVYAIFGSYFVFFNLFPINMYLQYKRIGKWKDYLYGEKTYIVLSLVAKTILGWLVFFGVMQP